MVRPPFSPFASSGCQSAADAISLLGGAMETIKERIAAYVKANAGATPKDVANALGISSNTVYRNLERLGLKLKRSARQPNSATLQDSGIVNVVQNAKGKRCVRVPTYVIARCGDVKQFRWRISGNDIVLSKVQ